MIKFCQAWPLRRFACLWWFLSHKGKWLFCASVLIGSAILTGWPQGLEQFRYDRTGVATGELWRVLTGHFVHLNLQHLMLNGLGLLLVCELLWYRLPLRHALGLLAAGCLGISFMLWWNHPGLAWYAGSSGILHALWAGAALTSLSASANQHGQRGDPEKFIGRWPIPALAGISAIALLFLKLAMEIAWGASTETVALIGAPIVTAAHLYGAGIGAAYMAIWRLVRTWQRA